MTTMLRTTPAEPSPDLGPQVVDHMHTHCPATPAGDWTIGQHPTDHTVCVVYRVGSSGFTNPGIRGGMLHRWHSSLVDAGFQVDIRNDMTVFGRPDEESDIAWWLRVTGRGVPEVHEPSRAMDRYPRALRRHDVELDPATTPHMQTRLYGLAKPASVEFAHWPTGAFRDGTTLTVTLYFADGNAEPGPLQLPDWLLAIDAQHRGHSNTGPTGWCYLTGPEKQAA